MIESKSLILTALGTFGITGMSAASASEPNLKKPNIVIFLVDDLGAIDVSFMGSKFYETPNIDRMSTEGMVFTSAYSACTVSSPTRAAMMTGKYPARLHLTDWIGGHNFAYAKFSPPDWKKYLDLGETTLADKLKAQGYTTWHLGKWHLGVSAQYEPLKRGFDVSIGSDGLSKGNGCNGYFSPYCQNTLADGPEGEYITDRLTAEAIKLIEANPADQPFFLNFCHYAVHLPLMARKADVDRWKERVDPNNGQNNPTYAAMIEATDKSLGALIEALRKKGILDNTIVIFTSDNGGLRSVTDNSPLRAGKGSAYEGGVRVPLVVMWKGGGIKGGSKCNVPVITMDIAATMMAITGAGQPEKTDGMSMIPLFQGKTLPERAIYWHYPHYHPGGSRTYSAIRQGDWKLIEMFETNSVELYNLRNDVSESVNLSASESAKTAELFAKLKKWQNEVKAQMPVSNPNYDPQKEYKTIANNQKE